MFNLLRNSIRAIQQFLFVFHFDFAFTREMKRILLLIDNFVPIEIKSRIYKQARYDEELEEWMNNSSHLNNPNGIRRPVSQPSRRRPISEYAIKATSDSDASATHLKSENIISHGLDMPLRTTYEYKNPKVSASLQAVIAEALENEDDIDISDQVYTYLELKLKSPEKMH